MADCKTSCPHKQRQNEPAHPTSEGCILQPGQVSITAIQDKMKFTDSHWRGNNPNDNVCRWCTADTGACVMREDLFYPTPLVTTLPEVVIAKAALPGYVFYSAYQEMDKLKDSWDRWMSIQYSGHKSRVNTVAKVSSSCQAEAQSFQHLSYGVSTS